MFETIAAGAKAATLRPPSGCGGDGEIYGKRTD
jgi:hypothetical protein